MAIAAWLMILCLITASHVDAGPSGPARWNAGPAFRYIKKKTDKVYLQQRMSLYDGNIYEFVSPAPQISSRAGLAFLLRFTQSSVTLQIPDY